MSLAGLGAVLAAVVVFSALKKREADVQRAMASTAQIVVAARDIPIGAKLQADDLKLARWSRDSTPVGSFTDPKAALGAFAKSQFAANEPVVNGRLFIGEKTAGVMPLLIPSGMRAMSVAVDEVADISGFVQPHTRVDVLLAVSGSGPGGSPFSRIVLQNIEVIAVAQEIERAKDEPEVVKVVTLLVTPIDAEKLSLANREGTIRLAMRNYSDGAIVATRGIAIDELMRHARADLPLMEQQPLVPTVQPPLLSRPVRGVRAFHVEILRDGRSSEAYAFVNSAVVGHSGGNDRAALPPAMASPAPTLSNDSAPSPPSPSPDGGVDPHSASLADTPATPMTPVLVPEAAASKPVRAPRPGDSGYLPAPKTFVIEAK